MLKIKNSISAIYIYQKNQITGFQHDITYGGFKDLPRRKTSDKLLRNKAFDIAKNPKYNKHKRDLD